MLPVKMLFTDLDGTLLCPDHVSITERTRKALLDAKDRGITLCIATGRCLHIIPESIMNLGFEYAITSNGGSAWNLKTGELLFSIPPTVEEAKFAIDTIHEVDPFIEFFDRGHILMLRRDYDAYPSRSLPRWHNEYFSRGNTPIMETLEDYYATGLPTLEKIQMIRSGAEHVAYVSEKLRATGNYILSSSIGGGTLEVGSIRAGKGNSLKKLCSLLNVSPLDCAAFGDNNNDNDMLSFAGCSVAVGNAIPEIKALARFTTEDFDKDGVAKFIESHLL